MATKKASKSASSSSQDWLKWVYVGGVIVAGLATALNFTAADPYLGWVLLLAGLAVGFFYFDASDVQNFGLRYLILGLVVTAGMGMISAIPAVGGYIAGFFTGFFNFLGPVVLAQIIVYFWRKYFGSGV
jgi:hypothetical protein